MKIKKFPFVLSFAIAALLVVGQASFADNPDQDQSMMNSNGMGMSNMMGNEGMGKMMQAMNSPEGQKMMSACSEFMESYDSDETAESGTVID